MATDDLGPKDPGMVYVYVGKALLSFVFYRTVLKHSTAQQSALPQNSSPVPAWTPAVGKIFLLRARQ